jgi:hypothetical protein
MKNKLHLYVICALILFIMLGNILIIKEPPILAKSLKVKPTVKKEIKKEVNFEALILEINKSNKVTLDQIIKKKKADKKRIISLEKKVDKLTDKVGELSYTNDSLVKVIKDSTIKEEQRDSLKVLPKKGFLKRTLDKILNN